jgi:hypothetical protein
MFGLLNLAWPAGVGDVMSLEEERQQRIEFMRRLKDEIDGSSAWSVDPRIIGHRMGLHGWDTSAIVNQLVEAALVEEVYGEEVRLTDAGRREVEQSQSVSTDSQMAPKISMHFSGNAYGVQAGTVGSNQYVAVNLVSERATIQAFLTALRQELDELPISAEERDIVTSDIDTVEAQLRSPKPRNAVLREAVSSLREVVLGAAGSGAFAGLVELAQHIHV